MWRQCLRIRSRSRQMMGAAKGSSTIVAVDQRKAAKVTGGSTSPSPRAMMKLPDQMSVANRAQSEPKLLLGVTLTDHFEADLGDGLLNGFG